MIKTIEKMNKILLFENRQTVVGIAQKNNIRLQLPNSEMQEGMQTLQK